VVVEERTAPTARDGPSRRTRRRGSATRASSTWSSRSAPRAAPDEASWERHTRILDMIEQVRTARELRRQRGLGLSAGW